jgi:predicted metalloprotease
MLAVMAAPLPQLQPSVAAGSPGIYQFSRTVGNNRMSTPITQAELNTVVAKTKSALTFLDRFWGGVFAASQRSFRKPGVKVMGSGQAFYSSQDHTIYLNPAFFVERMRAAAEQTRTDGDMAFIVILAHEYGHSVQQQLALLGNDCLRVELQADRMAGAFAKAAREAGLIDPGDFDEATYTFFTGRDQTDKYYECAHGSGTQRVEAFHSGLKGGVKTALQ